MPGLLLAGRRSVVVSVAYSRSLAWAVAQSWWAAGAEVAVVAQSERAVP